MAERDPFGRLPDENPLAGLGSLSDTTHSQAAEPVVVAADEDWSGGEPATQARPAPPRAAPKQPRATPPRTGNAALDQSLAEAIRQAEAMSGVKVVQSVQTVSRIVKLVVFLIVIGVLAGVGSTIFSAGKDVTDAISDFDSTRKAFEDTEAPKVPEPSTPTQVAPERPAAPPTGLGPRSMFVRSNFRPAVARMSTSGLGRLRQLAIRPERIDAQLLTKGGALRSVQVRFDEKAINKFATSGSGFGHLPTIPFAKVNTAAPARLARSAAGRSQRPVSQVDYIVLTAAAGRIQWYAYLKGGRGIYQADSRGRIIRRIS